MLQEKITFKDVKGVTSKEDVFVLRVAREHLAIYKPRPY